MENSAKAQVAKNVTQNPKPSDEVQLEIETVTPDTEKEVSPTQNMADEKNRPAEPNDGEQHEPEDKQTDQPDTAEEVTAQEAEVSNENPAKDEGNDERDQIETVSP